MNNRHIKIGLVFIGICMIVGLVLAYLSVPHEKTNVSDTPTASSSTSAASAMPAGNVAGPQQKVADFIITDALLASQKTLDQLSKDTPLTVCLGDPITLSNASKRAVQLATTPPQGADGPEDIQTLGAVRSGEIFRFSPITVSEFNITEVDGGFLARVHVNQCGGTPTAKSNKSAIQLIGGSGSTRTLMFSCMTKGDKKVEVYDNATEISYSFGPKDKPDIAFSIPRGKTKITPWDGMGRFMNNSIDIPSGTNVVYQVVWATDRDDADHQDASGVTVLIGGIQKASIKCVNDPEGSLVGI